MFCTFVSVTSLTPDSKPCDFVTLRKLIKIPQNFVLGYFSIQLTLMLRQTPQGKNETDKG